MCDPYVDMECVKSQAAVLLPNIIEAGKNVIKLFIPKLSVEIKSLDKDALKGEIKHKTDNEYTEEIKYTGEVILTIKDKNNREINVIKVKARNGNFEDKGIKLSKDEKLTARIEFGGISVESADFIGVSDNIFGVYEGKYTMQINEANLLQMYLDNINPAANAQTRIAGEEDSRNLMKMFISNVNWIKGGAQGGPIAKFEIGKTKGMEYYYETVGLKYYVYNLSNNTFIPKFLTPLVDKSNAGTILQCQSNGFNITTFQGKEKITVNAAFKGNNLVGEWNASYKGKVMWSATFSAQKIADM